MYLAAYEYVFGGLRDSNFDDWRKAFETNVLGAYTVMRPVADAMKESGGGAVVFIGSLATFKPSLPQAGYAASKGALLSAMYYLADELGADNLHCVRNPLGRRRTADHHSDQRNNEEYG